MGDATIASIVILGIVVVSILILIATIFACIFAYKAGKRSGNKTTSIILIVAGIILVGITFWPGICHLIGTTQAKK